MTEKEKENRRRVIDLIEEALSGYSARSRRSLLLESLRLLKEKESNSGGG